MNEHGTSIMKKENTTDCKKIAGILTPLFALRGENDLGIGDTAALSEMIAWTSKHGFKALQILPINEMGKNNSPYNILSALALEPSTITTHPSWLPELSLESYQRIIATYDLKALRAGKVQYALVKNLKQELLTAAWEAFQKMDSSNERIKQYDSFQKEHSFWLSDYTLYRTLLEKNNNEENFMQWDPAIRQASSARTWLETLPTEECEQFEKRRDFFTFVQWIAITQWKKVYATAEKFGVALIGDVPIGVHCSGADVFSAPELFNTNSFGGAPPEKVFQSDPFTMKWGQNWGIPLYKWEQMSHDNFSWWRHRLRLLHSLFHFLRIDHTLGLFRIYSFPWSPEHDAEFTSLTEEEAKTRTNGLLPHFVDYDDETLEHTTHNRHRGERLLHLFQEEVGKGHLIAEDLGEVPPYVPLVLSALKIPGFKIPLWVRHDDQTMIAGCDYPRISVATYATHDHQPFRTQWENWQTEVIGKGPTAAGALKTLQELLTFINRSDLDPLAPYEEEIHPALLKGLYATNSKMSIVMITDLFGSTQQFNVPGATSLENWTERIALPIASWDQEYSAILTASHKALQECLR